MQRTLYIGNKNASSWALRAWLALREQGLPFEEQVVDIRRPQRFANLARIARFSPPGAVPVLVEDDVVIFDSLAIMEYASEIGPRPLWPSDPTRRAKARSLAAWVHAGLSSICTRLSFEASFYPQKRLMTAQELVESDRIFDVWGAHFAGQYGTLLVRGSVTRRSSFCAGRATHRLAPRAGRAFSADTCMVPAAVGTTGSAGVAGRGQSIASRANG